MKAKLRFLTPKEGGRKMEKIIFAMLMLTGCADVKFSGNRANDKFCGRVGEVEVWNRDNSAMGCPEAMAWTQKANEHYPLTLPWAVYFTSGFAGFYVDHNFNASTAVGMTYVKDLDIVVSTVRPQVIYHEFGHAWDIEHHLSNHRDGFNGAL